MWRACKTMSRISEVSGKWRISSLDTAVVITELKIGLATLNCTVCRLKVKRMRSVVLNTVS